MLDINQVIKELKQYDGEKLTFMEVCGTHTASIAENGIQSIISPSIRLISGPGCPVCVTVASYIDRLIEISKETNMCVVTFGDMIRVRGSRQNLREAMAEGGRAVMVYSPMEIIEMAEKDLNTTFVFAAVGFETTTPVYALILDEIIAKGITNVKFLTALKTMPKVIEKVCEMDSDISGFIAPGHVAVLTGSNAFIPLAEKYSIPFVVSGFEGEELLASIYALMKLHGRPIVKNMYTSAVMEECNKEAANKVNKYFEPYDAAWRGLGIIPNSGMILKKEYKDYDLGSRNLIADHIYNKGCSCADIITGRKTPNECGLFGKMCTPESPQGACMVSMEGSCFNYYINGRC